MKNNIQEAEEKFLEFLKLATKEGPAVLKIKVTKKSETGSDEDDEVSEHWAMIGRV